MILVLLKSLHSIGKEREISIRNNMLLSRMLGNTCYGEN